jgi:hypothetical protein
MHFLILIPGYLIYPSVSRDSCFIRHKTIYSARNEYLGTNVFRNLSRVQFGLVISVTLSLKLV